MNGNTHLVRFLVQDHGAAIDVLTLRKQTPLHLAAGAGQLLVCRLLLELGASIDATDDQGQKPIHAAAMNNYAEVAQLFLQRHPSLVMACTKDGNTCAHIAAMQGTLSFHGFTSHFAYGISLSTSYWATLILFALELEVVVGVKVHKKYLKPSTIKMKRYI